MIEERFRLVAQSSTFKRLVRTFKLGDKRVLDIGCGFGEYLAHFGKGSVGITTTPEEVRVASERALTVILGNAEALETLTLPATFQCIWANNLFEHLLSPHAFLIRLRATVAPGALLILGVPVLPWPRVLMRFLKFRGALASNHINFFTPDTLALTVKRAGWRVREVRPFIFESAFLDQLVKLIAPHMYVIAELDASFAYPPKKVREWENEPYYREMLDTVANTKTP